MNTALPSDLLNLKARFESWRRTRTRKGPIPDHLRKAAIALLDEHSTTLICRVCRLHPRTLQTPAASKSRRTASAKPSPDFFPLPPALPQADLFSSIGPAHSDCRLLLERPDGARLTIVVPGLDPASIPTLCSNFLRS